MISYFGNKVRNTTHTRFICSGGDHKYHNTRSQKFVCHRSGYYHRKQNPMTVLKSQGSCKLNAFCPAEIKYLETNDIYRVTYIKTHSHEIELGHIRLLREDRIGIANKIAADIPFDTILDQIRESIYKGEYLKQINLITRKEY